MTDLETEFYERCFLCERKFQYSNHIYSGRLVKAFGIMVCNGCDNANYDGIGPIYEEKLVTYLESKGIRPPKKNAKGFIPLPPKGF